VIAGWTSEPKAQSISEKGGQMNIQGMHPSMIAPVLGQTASSSAAASGTSATSGSSSSSSNGISSANLQDTFLNLLVTELQNQDPTAPVDPTQMVGQLVSLNQLDQLISINSTLQNLVPSTSSSGNTSQTGGTGSSGSSGSSGATPANAVSASVAPNQLQPANTSIPSSSDLMNLYGSFGAPAQTSNLTTKGGR
jgi:flagellar basal-body rod modification protein FlgD